MKMAKSEQTLMQQVCGVFTGPLKRWVYFGMLIGVVFTVALFYSGWRFWIAESVNDHLHWGLAVILSALFVAMMKLWFWLQMMQNSIIRELKGS